MLFCEVVMVFTSFADKPKSVDSDMSNDSDSGDGVYVGQDDCVSVFDGVRLLLYLLWL
eukprot:TRINITY_DN452_c0_g1_i3.p2 TRINITY_DN452_c0_g1~~TRINITY_DN452_c0_g1_i3.p2  ORF type:complete len:58 (-),score=9.90 TRINITY_DN452_c0_g1_i3:245-418(-)